MRTSAPRPLFPEGTLTDRVKRRAQMPAVFCFTGNFSEIPCETKTPRGLCSLKSLHGRHFAASRKSLLRMLAARNHPEPSANFLPWKLFPNQQTDMTNTNNRRTIYVNDRIKEYRRKIRRFHGTP